MSFKKSKEPIQTIVNELSKLKQQLKSIKSMRTLPLVQAKNQANTFSTKRKQSKNIQTHNKSHQKKMMKKKSTTKNHRQSIQQKSLIQTERKNIANEIDMSSCKKIMRSCSQSKSQSKSKSKERKDKKKKNKKNSKLTKTIQKIKQKETQELELNNGFKNLNIQKNSSKKSMLKVSPFDNLYAATKDVNQERIMTDNESEIQDLKAYNQYQDQDMDHQDVRFSQTKEKNKRIKSIKQKLKTQSKVQVGFKQVNLGLKAIGNYEPKFNELRFITNKFQQNKQRTQSNYALKSQLLLNKLKRALLRCPNFAGIFIETTKQNIPTYMQRHLIEQNDKSLQKVQQKYTQFLQQVQCNTNALINLMNQYHNQREAQLITMQQKRLKLHLNQQKENMQSNVQQQINRQQQCQSLRRQLKLMKKQVKRLQKQLKQKQQQLIQLQFRYVVKLEQEETKNKNQVNLLLQRQPQHFQQKNIQSHIQILQEQNLQLYEKVQLLNRQKVKLSEQLQQFKSQVLHSSQRVLQLQKQLQKAMRKQKLDLEDLNLKKIQIESLSSEVKNIISQKSKQTQKYRRKIMELEQQLNHIKRQLKEKNSEFQCLSNQIKKLEKSKTQQQIKKVSLQQENLHINKLLAQQSKTTSILNKKIQQMTKQNMSLASQLSLLNQQKSHLSSQLSAFKQQLSSFQSTQKRNLQLSQQNNRILQTLKSSQEKRQELQQNINLLKTQLENEQKKSKKLQEAIQRYKDRCIKAEVRLKEQKYLDENMQRQDNTRKKQNIEEIKNIIKQHQNRLKLQQ